MHLVTGMILTALAGRAKQKKSMLGMPMLRTGPLQVAHALPGRIRFLVPSLKMNPDAATAGLAQLGKLQGITCVESSPVTGSVTVRYNPDRIDPPLLFGLVARLLGLEEALDAQQPSVVMREIKEMTSSIDRMVYDETRGFLDLRTIVVGGLLFWGGKKVLQDRFMATPGGLTLIWWAVMMMQREGRRSA